MGINTGALYIIFIMLAILGFAYITSGPTPDQTPILTGPEVVLINGRSGAAKANLQLYNFNGATITPPISGLCTKHGDNKHPEALIAYELDQASAVSVDGQIKLWVSDTLPPYISQDEEVAKSSGSVLKRGIVTGPGSLAPDTYLWEPALYVFPRTVDNSGKPYFPSWVQGDYNNITMVGVAYGGDSVPPYSLPLSRYTVEFTWNVNDIGLTDGEYMIEFVAHDGNKQLGVRCINIRVFTPPAIFPGVTPHYHKFTL